MSKLFPIKAYTVGILWQGEYHWSAPIKTKDEAGKVAARCGGIVREVFVSAI